jgi:hypothetical protein
MKLPNSYYNTISFFGSLIAGFCLILIVFMFIVSALFLESGGYIGLVVYIILPVIMIIGLLMIPLGMFLKIRRERRSKKEETRWKVIDLNNKRTRNAMIIFVIGTFVILFLSAIGSYKAFHYTESNEFCGTVCHSVMTPEYTAYQLSSHARVKCVECHVGEGADWYVKSKLSGLYQVYSVTFKKYPKPIPTPIQNLRPAQETCEKCHWPDKFYSNRLVHTISYLADTFNTECFTTLMMKTSAGHETAGHSEGIHWHINPNVKIEYISKNEKRDTIPWVKYTNLTTGEVTIYEDETGKLEEEQVLKLSARKMDCMDCHNRPSHLYQSPTDYIDDGLTKGSIPKDLMYIKQIAMQVLKVRFGTNDSTYQFINDSILAFYKTNYPEIYKEKLDLINKAIKGIKDEFSVNSFPQMNVYSESYVNHIGHQETKGCFRCHSGTHVSTGGKKIRNDCNLCHTIIAQGVDTLKTYTNVNSSLEFHHPVDIDDAWKEMHCSDCHGALY